MQRAKIQVTRVRWVIAVVIAALGIITIALATSIPGASASGKPLPGSPVPRTSISRLTEVADSFARVNGDTRPTSVSVVTTTHAKALTSATPGDALRNGVAKTVYLVTMKGSFKGYGASVPEGAAMPTGKYLSIVIDATTFRVLDWGLSGQPSSVSPSSLGPVTYLTQ